MTDLPPHWKGLHFQEALSLIAEFKARRGHISFKETGAPYIGVENETNADFARVCRLQAELYEILGPAGLSPLDDENDLKGT